MGADPFTLAAGATLGSSILGSRSASKAASAQEKAAGQAAQVQREALESFKRRTQPFAATGLAAADPLLAALGIQRIPIEGAAGPLAAPVAQSGMPATTAAGLPAEVAGEAVAGTEQDTVGIQLEGLRNREAELQRAIDRASGASSRFNPGLVNIKPQMEAELAQVRSEIGNLANLVGTGVVQTDTPFTDPRALPEGQAPQQAQPQFRFEQTALPEIGLDPNIMQNPLLQSIQDEAARRAISATAATGRTGAVPGQIARALAGPALNLALQQQQTGIQQRQQNISNLFNLLGLGANVAAGQGTAGMQTAQGVAQALQTGGAAQAAGRLGQTQAITGGLGSLAGLNVLQQGGFFNPAQQFTGELFGGLGGFRPTIGELFGGLGGFRPTIGGQQAAGPLLPSGRF